MAEANTTGHVHRPVHADLKKGSLWVCLDCKKVLSKSRDVDLNGEEIDILIEFIKELTGAQEKKSWNPSAPKKPPR